MSRSRGRVGWRLMGGLAFLLSPGTALASGPIETIYVDSLPTAIRRAAALCPPRAWTECDQAGNQVLIRVRIGPNGGVDEAHVERRFPRTACPDTSLAVAIDAAILEAVRGWRFQLPETVRRGTAATIVYRFPPRREDTWAYGCLWGRVLDDSTGRPIPYVNVILLGTRVGMQTDTAGAFNFEMIPPGSLRIQAGAIWFDTVTREIPVRAGQVDSIELRLRRNPFKIVIVDTVGRPR